ncbi:MAG: ABC transporter permease [Cytophagaceae bacterium]|nr:ABC transporter permease [Gemmatimonadaceae bacterium]
MSLFKNLFARSRVERDLDQELRAYVELLVEEKVKQGMAPDDARRAARVEAGALEHIKDEVRDVRRGAVMESTWQDVRYGMRLLRRSPGFATLAVITIGLGIGANSAIFSVINGVVRKPLAYPASDRLMFITSQFPTLNFSKFWISPPEYFEFKEHTRTFSEVAAYTTGAMNLSEGERPERVNAAFITANMFDVLGVKPVRGQAFTTQQDLPNADPVVVISHELWQGSLGGDPNIVGRLLQIQGQASTVVGVMPPGFDLHDARAHLWMPLGLDPALRTNRGSHFLYLVGRMAPGSSAEGASAELAGMLRQWREWAVTGHAPNDSTHRLQMAPLQDEVVGNVKRALWVLQGAVLLVLLIACANVANLLLARAESRHREFAVRTALGAGRTRILRQFMVEGTVLSVLGAALGLGLAYWGLKYLLALNPDSIPRATEITLDPVVLAFTVGVALTTGLVFGLAPLLHLGEQAVTQSIRDGSARTTATVSRNRVRRGLVIGEIALAVMLVIGAGLLIRTFRNLTTVDAGFASEGRITFGVVLPQATYNEPGRRSQFITGLVSRLQEIPGVERASGMTGLPPLRQVNANDTDFEGYQPKEGDPPANVDYYQTATVGYFETMGIRMRDGRGFEPTDVTGSPVVVINEALAKRFYKDQNPIGRRLRVDGGPTNSPWFTIVGIARDVKQGGLENPAGTELYFVFEQGAQVGFVPNQMNLVVQTSRPVTSLMPAIRSTVTAMDPTLPIVQMRTMDDVVGDSLVRQRFLTQLLGIFAGVALLLAAIGTYGILAYMVSERQREIGIRMALGAGTSQVVQMVLRQGVMIAGIGIVVGIAGALALARFITTLLYGVSPFDPVTFLTVSTVIAVVAVFACLVPMRRATRVDPLTSIRAD